MKNGVVIVTYNRLELLRECLDCVMAQTLPFSHIVVVDNCSTDGTREYLKRLEEEYAPESKTNRQQEPVRQQESAPRLQVIYESRNLGGAGGFHDGMRLADTLGLDWILIIDDDAMIRPDYMELLIKAAEKESGQNQEKRSVNALAGSVYVDGKLHTMHRRNVASKLLFVEREIPDTVYTQESFLCDCATFCGLAVKGSVVKEIGLPEKEFFLWYDDSEYSLRLASYGRILCVPAAGLDHKTKLPQESEGLLERTGWRHYYGYRNRYHTAKVHFGRLSAACIALEYHVLSFLSRCMTLRKATAEKGRFNVQMIHDALADGKAGRLGKNQRYCP